MISTTLPLISVIVPVYNVEPFLHQCVDSILNQTYSAIEILLINDGSTDHSQKICEEYAEHYSNIITITQNNQGLSAARNTGILNSHGDYVSFIDSDDYINPDYISTLYEICTTYNCDIAQCDFLRTPHDENRILLDSKKEVKVYTGIEMCYNLYNRLGVQSVVACNKLYRRDLFDTIKYPVGRYHEDEATTYKLFYLSNNVGVTRQILYYYRQSQISITRSPYSLKRLDGLYSLKERMIFFEERKDARLYALALSSYVSLFPYHIKNITKYFPNTKSILKDLKITGKHAFKEAMHNPHLSSIEKCKTIVMYKFPTIAFLISKLRSVYKSLTKNRRLSLNS